MKILFSLKRIAMMSFLIVAAFVFTGQSASAETAQHILVTPSSTAFSIDAGAKKTGSLSVINEGDSPFVVDLSSAPYRVEGLNYDPKFTQLPGTTDASEWVTFTSTTSQTVEARKLATIDYTVTVPAGTPAGGYYAVIFAETSPTENGSGVVAHNRVGDILYITVNGEVKASGNARSTTLPAVISSSATKLGVIVSNDGGTHFVTKVDMTVKDIFGKTAFSSTADRYVLPQTEREINATWSTSVPIGIFQVEQSATIPNATVQLPSRWVLVIQPWVILALIGLIVAIVTAVILNIRRSRPEAS